MSTKNSPKRGERSQRTRAKALDKKPKSGHAAEGRPHSTGDGKARPSEKKPRRVVEGYDSQWTGEEDDLRSDEGSAGVDDEELREWDEEDDEERAVDRAEESDESDEDDDEDDEDDYDDEEESDEDDDDVSPALSFSQKPAPQPQLTAPSRLLTDADHHAGYLERLNQRRVMVKNRGFIGAATGLPQLDEATGGLQQLTVLGAHTQTGKTSLAAQTCLAALRNNPSLVVVYYLLDNMSKDEFFDQMVCFEARVDHARYAKGKLSAEERKRVEAADIRLQKEIRPRMRTLGVGVHEGCFEGEWMFRCCRNFTEQVKGTQVLVVLDMFDNIPLPRISADTDPHYLRTLQRIQGAPDDWRRAQVLQLSELSKAVHRDGWPILLLTKLRKAIGRYDEPDIDDLLGGVELGYAAQRVFFLVPSRTDDSGSPVVSSTLVVKKARHARSCRIPLRFYHTQFRFEEVGAAVDEGSKRSVAATSRGKAAPNKASKTSPKLDPLAGLDDSKGGS